MSCPLCGEQKVGYFEGRYRYVCGYYKSFNNVGECKRTPKYEKINMMKPRVRVLYDDLQCPEEVRVILSPPTNTTELFDEFNGLIKVSADRKTQKVHDIRLDCHAIGGKNYEKDLIELIVSLNDLINRRQFHPSPSSENILQRCCESVGVDRVNSILENRNEDRKAKWGDLHQLVEDLWNSAGSYQNTIKLTEYINQRPNDKKLDTAHECMEYCIEEFNTSKNAYLSRACIDAMMAGLGDEIRMKLIENSAAQKNYDIKYWRDISTWAESALNPSIDLNDLFDLHRKVYHCLLKQETMNPKEDYKGKKSSRLKMIKVCELVTSIMDDSESQKCKDFYQLIADNDPEESVRNFAKKAIENIETGFGETEGEDIGTAMGVEATPDEWAQPQTQPQGQSNQYVFFNPPGN